MIYKIHKFHPTIVIITAIAILLGSLLGALLIGMPGVSLSTAWHDPTSWEHAALWRLQVPRLVQGLAVGATLGVAGATLQGLLRNPLADPFILGVSGGAALGSASVRLLAAALGATATGTGLLEPAGGFLGALLALLVVVALGSERGQPSPLRMLLIGVVVNALAGAALMVLAALGPPELVQRTLIRLMGTLGADPSAPWLLAVVVGAAILALAATWPAAHALNVLALGDETAASLGVHPERLRLRLFVLLSVAVGAVVAVTGLIGFAGLLVPHVVRRVLGPDHRRLIPASALVGAAFLVLADAVVSALAPSMGTELPVGVLTALIGGPLFLVLLRTRSTR